ncbi:MAG: hypothetical protein OEQ53_18470 [Saprospiraceae bacterium]|nr:hypothetical protein [Saprospiraceae bacterium]
MRSNFLRLPISSFMLVAFVLGCLNELEQPFDLNLYGYAYFPLEVGKFRVYEVDSLQFDIGVNDLPTVDSARFYVREEVVEILQAQTGEEVYRIERYRADDLDEPWKIMDVTTESLTTNQAHRTENNLRFINLVFPIEEGVVWDGNQFIPDDIVVFVAGESVEMFKNWRYEILSEGLSESIGQHTFESVATVQQANDENEIEFRFSQEKYAENVGLVYRERWILDSYCKYTGETGPCIGLDWRSKSGRGFIMREAIIDFN